MSSVTRCTAARPAVVLPSGSTDPTLSVDSRAASLLLIPVELVPAMNSWPIRWLSVSRPASVRQVGGSAGPPLGDVPFPVDGRSEDLAEELCSPADGLASGRVEVSDAGAEPGLPGPL